MKKKTTKTTSRVKELEGEVDLLSLRCYALNRDRELLIDALSSILVDTPEYLDILKRLDLLESKGK